jgi:hypothetical protein
MTRHQGKLQMRNQCRSTVSPLNSLNSHISARAFRATSTPPIGRAGYVRLGQESAAIAWAQFTSCQATISATNLRVSGLTLYCVVGLFGFTPVQNRFFGCPIWKAPERLGKRLSNEGHGFSRAVIGCALDGLAAEVRFSTRTGRSHPSPQLRSAQTIRKTYLNLGVQSTVQVKGGGKRR